MPTLPESVLKVLRCPRTHQPLREADGSTLNAINRTIASGQARNHGGKTLSSAWDAALITDNGDVAYPIQEGIPVLLREEGMTLKETLGTSS